MKKLSINEIYNMDCLEGMEYIPDGIVDMVLTDLPYGTTRNRWDIQISLPDIWCQYNRIIKPNGCIALFAQSPFDKILAMSNIEMFRYEWVWQKTLPSGHLNANRMPLKAHEHILIFYKKLPRYYPQMTYGHKRKVSLAQHKETSKKTTNWQDYGFMSYDSTERYPTSILTFARDTQKSAFHPTQKPVALCEYLIKTYTNEGELVLDSCMGSGTTAVACINIGRKFIGFETDMEYYEIAKHRILCVK